MLKTLPLLQRTQSKLISNRSPAGSLLGLSASSSVTSSRIAALCASVRSRPFRGPAAARSCAFSSSRLRPPPGAAPELSVLTAESSSAEAEDGAAAWHAWRGRCGSPTERGGACRTGLHAVVDSCAVCLMTSGITHGVGDWWTVGAGSIFDSVNKRMIDWFKQYQNSHQAFSPCPVQRTH